MANFHPHFLGTDFGVALQEPQEASPVISNFLSVKIHAGIYLTVTVAKPMPQTISVTIKGRHIIQFLGMPNNRPHLGMVYGIGFTSSVTQSLTNPPLCGRRRAARTVPTARRGSLQIEELGSVSRVPVPNPEIETKHCCWEFTSTHES